MDQDSLFKQYQDAFEDKEEATKKKADFAYAYSPFALQDAIGEKNIKKIWIEYQKLRLSGIEAEELIHKVASKARDMLAIMKGATKQDLNIKSDYPYNKSKKDSKNWNEESLKRFYTALVSVYHKARMGEDLDTALERTILDLAV